MEQRRAKEHSIAALAIFETEAHNAGTFYQCPSIEDLLVEAASALGYAAELWFWLFGVPNVEAQPCHMGCSKQAARARVNARPERCFQSA